MGSDKEYAQQLLNQLTPGQVAAVVYLMEAMLHPASRKLANVPIEEMTPGLLHMAMVLQRNRMELKKMINQEPLPPEPGGRSH